MNQLLIPSLPSSSNSVCLFSLFSSLTVSLTCCNIVIFSKIEFFLPFFGVHFADRKQKKTKRNKKSIGIDRIACTKQKTNKQKHNKNSKFATKININNFFPSIAILLECYWIFPLFISSTRTRAHFIL